LELICDWLDTGAMRRGFISQTKGIPQGSCLSPFLCNLYLTEWDFAMSDKNLPFVRYADDFLVFARSKKEAIDAKQFIMKYLRRLKLELHPEKTHVTFCGPHITFLGRKLRKPNTKRRNK